MRYLIPLIVATFVSFGFVSSKVDAGQRSNCPRCQQVRRTQQPGVLKKLFELERRKNSWLRRTILSR